MFSSWFCLVLFVLVTVSFGLLFRSFLNRVSVVHFLFLVAKPSGLAGLFVVSAVVFVLS